MVWKNSFLHIACTNLRASRDMTHKTYADCSQKKCTNNLFYIDKIGILKRNTAKIWLAIKVSLLKQRRIIYQITSQEEVAYSYRRKHIWIQYNIAQGTLKHSWSLENSEDFHYQKSCKDVWTKLQICFGYHTK